VTLGVRCARGGTHHLSAIAGLDSWLPHCCATQWGATQWGATQWGTTQCGDPDSQAQRQFAGEGGVGG